MTEQEGAIASPRPPAPVSFNTMKSSNTSSNSASVDSREVLRKEVQKRRMSLTPQEQVFLEELTIHGNEVELVLARKTLLDENLFFDRSDTFDGWGDSISLGKESDVSCPLPETAPLPLVAETSLGSRSAVSLGSIKRQEHLMRRRNNELHGQMWKAHENGLAVTDTGSKQSMRRRSLSEFNIRESRSSLRRSSFLSQEIRNLILKGGLPGEDGDDIFRNGLSPRASGRRVSWQAENPSVLKRTLRRMTSDGSRKSVSFAESPEDEAPLANLPTRVPRRVMRKRNVSTDTQISDLGMEADDYSSYPRLPPTMPPPRPLRSDSISSIPSLHHPNPVRSESMSSIPSLHHGHLLQSDLNNSSLSIPSIHHGHPVRSDSQSHISFLSDSSSRDDESRDPAWASPSMSPTGADDPGNQILRHPAQEPVQRPVLMRRASQNNYNGEGIEVSELDVESEIIKVDKARKFRSMLSFGETTASSYQTASSFDENANRDSIFRDLRRSISDDGRSSFFLGSSSKSKVSWTAFSFVEPLLISLVGSSKFTGGSRLDGTSVNTLRPEEDEEDILSWDMDRSQQSEEENHYDAWNVLKENSPAAVSYGGGGTLPFRILGTSVDDEAATPHVLSPPLMESLQNFFPCSLSETNFWMKYSLLRDGASMHSLLQKTRGAKHTIIAIETVDGEVFGSFTSDPWRKNWKYFGTGESFLWRMRKSRNTPCKSIIDQAHLESELDVYPWSGANNCIQLCTHDTIAVGGGSAEAGEKKGEGPSEPPNYGFGLALEKNLLYGTSSSCATFSSPPLSPSHQDGSPFEIVNLEVWAFTPCETLQDAEKLELGQLFLRTN